MQHSVAKARRGKLAAHIMRWWVFFMLERARLRSASVKFEAFLHCLSHGRQILTHADMQTELDEICHVYTCPGEGNKGTSLMAVPIGLLQHTLKATQAVLLICKVPTRNIQVFPARE